MLALERVRAPVTAEALVAPPVGLEPTTEPEQETCSIH